MCYPRVGTAADTASRPVCLRTTSGDALTPLCPQTVAFSIQHKESALRTKRLKRDHSLGSLGGISRDPSRTSLGGKAAAAQPPVGPPVPGPNAFLTSCFPTPTSPPAGEAEGADAAASIPPEDVAAEVRAAVEAVKGAKPVGSPLCLDTVRRLRQLLSNYDEPPLKEAVQGAGRRLACAHACLFTAAFASAPAWRGASTLACRVAMLPCATDPVPLAERCSQPGVGAPPGAAAAAAVPAATGSPPPLQLALCPRWWRRCSRLRWTLPPWRPCLRQPGPSPTWPR